MLRLSLSPQLLRHLKTLPVPRTAMTAPPKLTVTNAGTVIGHERRTASAGTAAVIDVAREISMEMKT